MGKEFKKSINVVIDGKVLNTNRSNDHVLSQQRQIYNIK